MDAASSFCAASSLVIFSVLYHGLYLMGRKVFPYKTALKSLQYISLCYRGIHKSATQWSESLDATCCSPTSSTVSPTWITGTDLRL